MPTPTVINKFRYSDVINRRNWDNKYFFSPMNVNPACAKVGGGQAAGGSAEVDVMIDNKNVFEYFNVVGNTNLGPKLDGSFGLNLASDATSTHAVEYDTGITPQNPFTFTIDNSGNTTPAFFIKGQFKISTIAGVSLLMGFRKQAARNATFTSYTDYATIGTIAGEFETQTNLANAGAITTDTTQAGVDATTYEIAIFVDSFGNVTYQINGQPPVVSVPYQFANGLIIQPVLRVTQNVTTSATASCNYFECGFQS